MREERGHARDEVFVKKTPQHPRIHCVGKKRRRTLYWISLNENTGVGLKPRSWFGAIPAGTPVRGPPKLPGDLFGGGAVGSRGAAPVGRAG